MKLKTWRRTTQVFRHHSSPTPTNINRSLSVIILAAACHRIRDRSLLGVDVTSENGMLPEREKKREKDIVSVYMLTKYN